MSWCQGVLLKCPWGVIATDLASDARGIGTGKTRYAVATGRGHPLDAYSVPDLQARALGTRSEGGDSAHTFMPTNLSFLGGSRQPLPGVEHDTHVAMADA